MNSFLKEIVTVSYRLDGKQFRTFLKERGISLTDFARQVGTSVQYFHDLCSGRRIGISQKMGSKILKAAEKKARGE